MRAIRRKRGASQSSFSRWLLQDSQLDATRRGNSASALLVEMMSLLVAWSACPLKREPGYRARVLPLLGRRVGRDHQSAAAGWYARRMLTTHAGYSPGATAPQAATPQTHAKPGTARRRGMIAVGDCQLICRRAGELRRDSAAVVGPRRASTRPTKPGSCRSGRVFEARRSYCPASGLVAEPPRPDLRHPASTWCGCPASGLAEPRPTGQRPVILVGRVEEALRRGPTLHPVSRASGLEDSTRRPIRDRPIPTRRPARPGTVRRRPNPARNPRSRRTGGTTTTGSPAPG